METVRLLLWLHKNTYSSKGVPMYCFTAAAYCLLQISLFSFSLDVQQPLSDCTCASVVSAMAGLLALLLIVLEWTRPGLPSPLRPICDLRVLNHFIKEARDAEVAMVRGKCMHALRSKSRRSLLQRYCGPAITHTVCVPLHKSAPNTNIITHLFS